MREQKKLENHYPFIYNFFSLHFTVLVIKAEAVLISLLQLHDDTFIC